MPLIAEEFYTIDPPSLIWSLLRFKIAGAYRYCALRIYMNPDMVTCLENWQV